jgi:hypothetical protein
MLPLMRTSQRLTLISIALALATFGYFSIGLGYHRLSVACYDSRHSIDQEPMVGGGPVGVVIDALLWPVFLAALSSDGISCLPRRIGE